MKRSRLFTRLAHLRFDLDKNALQDLKTGDRRMAYNPGFGSIMEVVRECIYGWVVGSIVPSLDQMPIGILPMVAVLGDLKDPLGGHHALGHFDEAPIRQGDAVAVIQHGFQVCIPDRSSNDGHIPHDGTGTEKLINLTEVLLNHASDLSHRPERFHALLVQQGVVI